jgi:hypothetical protein
VGAPRWPKASAWAAGRPQRGARGRTSHSDVPRTGHLAIRLGGRGPRNEQKGQQSTSHRASKVLDLVGTRLRKVRDNSALSAQNVRAGPRPRAEAGLGRASIVVSLVVRCPCAARDAQVGVSGSALACLRGMLDQLVPAPRKVEVNTVDLAAPPALVWQHVRHGDLGDSPLIRALFDLRTMPSRLSGHLTERAGLHIDDLRSTSARPGFQLLGEQSGHELIVGAIGKVWQLDIPFVHVAGPAAYADFSEPGWIKVAWAIRVEPLGEASTRLVFEVRVDATDDASWALFSRYWHVIGPGSHFIRHTLLAGLRRHFGAANSRDDERSLSGDELLPDAAGQLTHGITIQTTPAVIWPWLVQMGCRRGGFYAIDALDNAGVASAREIHPELQSLAVGDVIPATPEGSDGFEVLAIVPNRVLILGGLFDVAAGKQIPFANPRPAQYWHVTWAFVLESLDSSTTRVHVRARAAFSKTEKLHLAWIRPVHALMQTSQLRHLAARAEGSLARDTLRDVAAGVAGAAIMTLAWLTPFLRPARSHWGLSAEEASVPRPGDELVREPRWSWTHAVTLEAPCEQVWPWVAQIGADRAGFYSYQSLENVAGCNLHNAEAIHPGMAHTAGDQLVLHPKGPSLDIIAVHPGRSLVAFAKPDQKARAEGRPWAAASWAFLVEPLGSERCRVVSRFRSACSDDLAMRLMQGPSLLEPVGFAMDRRMLLGIRERVLARAASPREGGA